MNNKGIAPIMILGLIVIIGAIAGLLYFGQSSFAEITGSIGSGGYIERPVFKYVKCEALSGLKYSAPTTLATNGQWINKPSVSSYYEMDFNIVTPPLATRYKFNYYICNSKVLSESNCRVYNRIEDFGGSSKGKNIHLSNIKNNEYVWAQFQKSYTGFNWHGSTGAEYQIGFIPYGLREYDVLSGSANQINPNDCSIPSSDDSWVDRFLSSDSSKINSQISRNTNERTLQPEEVRWYVSGYVTSAEPSFALNYKGQNAWCRTTGSSAEIYRINTIRVGSGTYKIASPDWSDYLGQVNCCPKSTRGDEVCNDNFQWEKISGSECDAFKSCGSPNWVPYSEGQVIKYKCINGYCENEIKNVQCASDYDCKDSNQVCDLNSFTCADANVNLKGQEIETIPDNQEDCEARGGKWITKTTEKYSIFNYFGGGEPKVIVEEYCYFDEWDLTKIFLVILGIVVGLGLIFVIVRYRGAILKVLRI